ncbi:MAG: NACHT and WD repeat domain-containing protein [Bryobacteraceae bacterium]
MNSRSNPYVGPRSFNPGEQLYGRDREARDLEDLIIAERIVLLYSPSGAGKTSLLQAKLLPALEAARFRVRPIMRLSKPALDDSAPANRYVLSCLACLNGGEPEGARKTPEQLSKLTLAEYLGDPGKGDLLVFDQFEEILTLDPVGETERRAFFDELAECLKNRRRWALFSMREDYLAAMDPYRKGLPTKLATTFRLDLLDKDRAIEAMRGPAGSEHVDFGLDAASALADDLRRLRSSSSTPVYGSAIEPVQLQVVCYRLWQNLASDAVCITPGDLKSVAVDKALADYYSDCVAASANPIEERRIREWFEDRLITGQGNRAQVSKGPEQGLDDATVTRFIDAHLVRADGPPHNTWYELAHDRLIEPVLSSNAEWRKSHPDLLRDQCALWLRNGRSDGMLLRGAALARAEQQAAGEHLEPVEHEFLETCRKERRRHKRERLLLVCSIALALLAIGGFVYASLETRKAQRQTRLATSAALASRAILLKDTETDLASLLSVEAVKIASNFDSRNSLLLAAQASPNLLSTFAVGAATQAAAFNTAGDKLLIWGPNQLTILNADAQHPAVVRTVKLPDAEIGAFSPGAHLLAMSAPGVVRLWDLTDEPKAISELQLAKNRHAIAIAFNHDGSMLAAAIGGMHKVRLWNLSNPASAVPLGEVDKPGQDIGNVIGAIAFSPDGNLLAIVGGPQPWSESLGWMALWDIGTPSQPRQLALEKGIYGDAAAFSPDGTRLAVAGANGDIGGVELWNIVNPAQPVIQGIQSGSGKQRLTSVAFSPDSSVFLASSKWSAAGAIHVFLEPDTRQPLQPELAVLEGSQHAITGLAFNENGDELASVGGEHAVFWKAPSSRSQQATSPLVVSSSQVGGVPGLAVSPDKRTIATGLSNGTVQRWTLSSNGQFQRFGSPIAAHGKVAGALAFSPDGKTLATSSPYEQTVKFWDVSAAGSACPLVLQLNVASIVTSLAYSRDGKQFAATTGNNQVLRWTLNNGRATPLPAIATADIPKSVGFSPDGKTIAVGVVSNQTAMTMQFWEISSGNPHQVGALPQAIRVALSKDWKHATLALWNPPRLVMYHLNDLAKPVRGANLGPLDWNVEDLAFDQAGDTIASIDDNGGIQLFALHVVGPPKPLGNVIETTGKGSSLAFSADGQLLIATDGSNLMTLGIGTSYLITRNCGRANRNLTQPEWNQNVGLALEYRLTCPGFPAAAKETQGEE